MPAKGVNDDLRRLAEAATPGPWRFDPFQMANGSHGAMAAGAGPAIVTGTGPGRDADKDAAYIAALSPDRVLALLDRLAALEGALAVMGNALVRVHVECVDDDVDGPLSAELFAVVDDAVVLYQREARAALAGTPKP